MSGIDRESWMQALREAELIHEEDDICEDAVTVQEMCEMMNCGREFARKHLDALVTAGKARKVTKRSRNRAGNHIRVSAYQLLTPKKG